MEGVRRRLEFLVGVPLVAAQYAAQRAADAIKDSSAVVRRERRNARLVGELTVRAVLARRGTRVAPGPRTGDAASATVSPIGDPPSSGASFGRYGHLGVAELLAAIPAMSPDERRALLAEERTGRKRSRVIEQLERPSA